MTGTVELRDSRAAFDDAIASFWLDADPASPDYAGLYMYTHTDARGDHFKHRKHRLYVRVPAQYRGAAS